MQLSEVTISPLLKELTACFLQGGLISNPTPPSSLCISQRHLTFSGRKRRKGTCFLILCLAAIAPHLWWAPVLLCCAQVIRVGLLVCSIVWVHFSLPPSRNSGQNQGQTGVWENDIPTWSSCSEADESFLSFPSSNSLAFSPLQWWKWLASTCSK